MAYKYATGSVQRGDIYNEDDAQGNTYLDWSEDAVGIIAGGALTLAVSGAVVHVSGSGTPLRVDGAISSSRALYGTDLVLKTNGASGIATFYIEGTNGTEIIGLAGGNMDVRSDGGSLNLLGGSGNPLYLGSDNSTYRVTLDTDGKFGIGTTSPSSTFEVSGSQAGNYTSTTASRVLGETEYMVDYTGNGDATITLPAVSGITGRVYHIISHAQGENDVLTVTGSGGQFQGPNLEGDTDSIDIEGWTPQSLTVVSTGGNWFILTDNRVQEHGG